MVAVAALHTSPVAERRISMVAAAVQSVLPVGTHSPGHATGARQQPQATCKSFVEPPRPRSHQRRWGAGRNGPGTASHSWQQRVLILRMRPRKRDCECPTPPSRIGVLSCALASVRAPLFILVHGRCVPGVLFEGNSRDSCLLSARTSARVDRHRRHARACAELCCCVK